MHADCLNGLCHPTPANQHSSNQLRHSAEQVKFYDLGTYYLSMAVIFRELYIFLHTCLNLVKAYRYLWSLLVVALVECEAFYTINRKYCFCMVSLQ